MIVCPRCRRENDDDAFHCASCRAYLGWTRGQPRTVHTGLGEQPPAAPDPAPPRQRAAGPHTAPPPESPPPVPGPARPIPGPRTSVPAPATDQGVRPGVPRRSIGTRIATRPYPTPPARSAESARTPSHTFDAVQPQESPGSGPSGGSPPRTVMRRFEPPRSGEVACPRCGRAVAADRRFCRCGAGLAPAESARPSPGPPTAGVRPDRLRRRTFREAMRAANGGLRVGYDAALSVRSQLFRGLFVLGMGGILLSQLGPWGGDLRARAYAWIDQVRPHGFEDVAVENATTDPPSQPVAGFDVKYAVDGKADRAWATPLLRGAAGDKPCARAGVAPALLITFRHEAKVDRVRIRAGLPGDNDRRTLQARPRQVDILFSDGTCRTVELADKPDAQDSTVGVASATRARLVFVDVFRPQDQGDGLVSLSEVTFSSRTKP